MAPFPSFPDTGDDPFAVALQMSDSDRQHDAWLPSDNTKNILITVATHAPGAYQPEVDKLCSPSLVITEPQVSAWLPAFSQQLKSGIFRKECWYHIENIDNCIEFKFKLYLFDSDWNTAYQRILLLAQIETYLCFYCGEKLENPWKTHLIDLWPQAVSHADSGNRTWAAVMRHQSFNLLASLAYRI